VSASPRFDVSLRPWSTGDLRLLERLLGEPEMTRYIGGPESLEAIRARHERYLASGPEDGGLFAITAGPQAEAVGWAGFWQTEWGGESVWECGWHVLAESQGQGIARAGTALMLERVRGRGTHRHLHAFPSVQNAASNALCRSLGFRLLGEAEVEYPRGSMMHSNDWCLDVGDVICSRPGVG
jgi:RimJ/RimL family protein N-acetyltransferase